MPDGSPRDNPDLMDLSSGGENQIEREPHDLLQRQELLDEFQQDGALINPLFYPSAGCTSIWLDDAVDLPRALQMGFPTPNELTIARLSGSVPLPHDRSLDPPVVVCWPAYDEEMRDDTILAEGLGRCGLQEEEDATHASGSDRCRGSAVAREDGRALAERNTGPDPGTEAMEITGASNADGDAHATAAPHETSQLPSLSQAQVQFFWKLPMLVRGGHTIFPRLKHADFSDMATVLKVWFSCRDLIGTLPMAKGSYRLNPLSLMLLLSANGKASNAMSLRGKLRHNIGNLIPTRRTFRNAPDNDSKILFGEIAWSEEEKEDYRSLTPAEQTRLSSSGVSFMWQKKDTLILLLYALPARLDFGVDFGGDEATYSFEYSTYCGRRSTVRILEGEICGPLFVLCMPEELILATASDLSECKELDLRIEKVDGSITRLSWSYTATSPACQEWAEGKAIPADDHLAENLLKRLCQLHQGIRATKSRPKSRYDRLGKGLYLVKWTHFFDSFNQGY